MTTEKKVEKIGRHSVFGIFRTRESLHNAVDALKAQNFRNSDISVLMQSEEGTRDFAFEKNTKAPEGATAGVVTGAALGGAFGWLVGAGALAIPGLGPFVAAGPIMAAIAGIGLGGTIGGVAGGLIGLGIPEFEARRYESFVKEGGLLISIHVDNAKWEEKAKAILEDYGAENVSTTMEKRSDTGFSENPRTDEIIDTNFRL